MHEIKRQIFIQFDVLCVKGGCMLQIDSVVVSISTLNMENLPFDDNDCGIFITQTPRENVELMDVNLINKVNK